METINVEAFEDRKHPEGGHVVILLAGLKAVPSRPSFRLRPVGADANDDLPSAWPEGKHLPLTARVTTSGVELVVGPDLAENPMLAPGTAVDIEFADAALRGDFLWPHINPLARPKRRSIIGRPQPREEHPDSAPVPGRHGDRPDTRPSLTTVGERRIMKKELSAMPEGSTHVAPQHMAPAENAESGRRSVTSDETSKPQKREPSDFVTFYPHARGGRLKAEKTTSGFLKGHLAAAMPTTLGGISGAIVAGVLLVHGAILVLQQGPGNVVASPAAAPAALSEQAAVGTLPADALFEALFTTTTSPRGVNARDIGSGKSLENAQAALGGADAARDTEEGSFWLKRYLQGALGDDRTLRALTHLGSTYAEPVGRAPDYTKARLVWEMAGAMGDPVAMCLLGVMHENGLGLVRDKKKALPWFERAKKAGGCPDVDDSIARTRQ